MNFDVAVIGAGVNGASAAQHLAAAGYSVLLVDKSDFASGSSSRSSRLLHCGLRYLAPGDSMLDFVLHPNRLAVAFRMAKQAMDCRAQIVRTAGERTDAMNFCFPIYRNGPYAPWQVDIAFRTLIALGPKNVPLDYRRLRPGTAKETPLIRWLRDQEKLDGIAMFREYQFEWPERLCLDAVLDAERMGAMVRNYTEVEKLERAGQVWRVVLLDTLNSGVRATVSAKVVLNTAGIWIDRVNKSAQPAAKRRITGTKGAHIMVRLPPECRSYGIATLNRARQPFYCVPWRGMHYFGPTETLYDGDIDDIRPLEEEIAGLIEEANWLLPSLRFARDDVLFAWAGVRPLTYDPELPKGKRSREVHDLTHDGMPGIFAMTAGPIMTHRSAGAELTRIVSSRLRPSRNPQTLSYAARSFPENQNSPPLLDHHTEVKLSDLRYAATHEHPANLVDLMFRRVGAGWTGTMGVEAAHKAAETIADVMGWDEKRIAEEAERYLAYVARTYRVRVSAPTKAA
jgi:glycerol-3-phosphate dehydrogenase